jgi:hypothetical protein
MTGAEVGTFLGSGSTNGAVFDRSDPRTTTAPQPSTIMKPVRTPWKGRGPVFNGSVDCWVALANPVPRVQRESAFHKPQDWFGPGISLDPRSSNFPCWRDRRRVRPASRPVKGFEPSVPLTWSAIPLEGRARDLDDVHPKVGFVEDSSLEEGGFEPSVPLRVDTDAERSKPGLTDEDDMRVRPL